MSKKFGLMSWIKNKYLKKSLLKTSLKIVETINKPGKYYDGNGLFLRVYPAGSRNWVQRVTFKGKRKELGLGARISHNSEDIYVYNTSRDYSEYSKEFLKELFCEHLFQQYHLKKEFSFKT